MKPRPYTAASIDGFIADSHNALDWLFQFGTDGASDEKGAAFARLHHPVERA